MRPTGNLYTIDLREKTDLLFSHSMYSSNIMIYTLKTIFILLQCWDIAINQPAEFNLNDFIFDPEMGMHGALIAQKKIAISNDITLDAVIKVSSHGNGSLTIANVENIKVYDDDDEGRIYRNKLLNIKFSDFDGDGYRDLIIVGIEDAYGDKDDQREVIKETRPIIFIYRFNPKLRKFEMIWETKPKFTPIYY